MPRMRDLPRLLDEDPRMREDFIAMLASFFERHHITVSPEDLHGAEDVVGYLFSADFIQVNEPAEQTVTAEHQAPIQDGDSDDDSP